MRLFLSILSITNFKIKILSFSGWAVGGDVDGAAGVAAGGSGGVPGGGGGAHVAVRRAQVWAAADSAAAPRTRNYS